MRATYKLLSQKLKRRDLGYLSTGLGGKIILNLFTGFKDAVSSSSKIASTHGMINEQELERIWKEGVVALLKVLFRYFPGVTEENHKTSVRIADIRAKVLTQDLPYAKEC
jgi:hypothetical protein